MSDKGETSTNGRFDSVVVAHYPLEQAFADDPVHAFALHRWPQLSQGKPIVVTEAVYHEVYFVDLVAIWNRFVDWRGDTRHTLPVGDHVFGTDHQGRTVHILENDAVFIFTFGEEY